MSTKEANDYPLVLCLWEDIISGDASWKEVDDAIQWVDDEKSLVRQCGYLIDKNDEYLVIVDSYFPGSTTVGTVTRIPMVVVRELKTIPVKDL